MYTWVTYFPEYGQLQGTNQQMQPYFCLTFNLLYKSLYAISLPLILAPFQLFEGIVLVINLKMLLLRCWQGVPECTIRFDLLQTLHFGKRLRVGLKDLDSEGRTLQRPYIFFGCYTTELHLKPLTKSFSWEERCKDQKIHRQEKTTT